MDSLQDSPRNELSSTTVPPATNSSCTSTPTKQARLRFQAADDLLLLREVVSFEHPFLRASTCWEGIASSLQAEFPRKLSMVAPRTLRERAQNLMETFLKCDAKLRKQSGTEEEFKEKEQLLECLRERYKEKDQKQAAKLKEKENKEKGERLRDSALLTLKEKNRSTAEVGEESRSMRERSLRVDFEQIWMNKKSMKQEEIKLKEKELDLRKEELHLQDKRALQAEQVNRTQLDMMQKQMQQMTDLISLIAKNSK